jgi:hypothetical protein
MRIERAILQVDQLRNYLMTVVPEVPLLYRQPLPNWAGRESLEILDPDEHSSSRPTQEKAGPGLKELSEQLPA